MLGNWIVTLGANSYDVTATDIIEPSYSNAVKADITNTDGIRKLFRERQPNIVIHTACETNVDKCEIEKERAWKINVEGTKNIAEACLEINAKLVYISTDYVFDGEKGLYDEQAAPNPIDFYGLTKLEGEKHVIRRCRDWAVLRTSVLFGRHPSKQDFATWVINKLKQKQEITVVDDHFNTPTLAENLAQMSLDVAKQDLNGIFHASGCERISRYDFARKIATIFGLDSNLVKPIKMNELKAWIAKRPRDSSLSTHKIQQHLQTKPLNINDGLNRLKEELKA